MGYITGKKELIIKYLSDNRDNSYSLEEICSAILKDNKGKSTVYRLVSRLVGEGTLRKISDEMSRHCTYQFVGGKSCAEHLHLKCKNCGKLIHLDKELSDKLEQEIMSSNHFALDDSTLLFGECEDCMMKTKGKKK